MKLNYKNHIKINFLIILGFIFFIIIPLIMAEEDPYKQLKRRDITIECDKKEIKEVLKDIEKQHPDVYFQLEEGEVNGDITINIKNESIFKGLGKILDQAGLYFALLHQDYARDNGGEGKEIGFYISKVDWDTKLTDKQKKDILESGGNNEDEAKRIYVTSKFKSKYYTKFLLKKVRREYQPVDKVAQQEQARNAQIEYQKKIDKYNKEFKAKYEYSTNDIQQKVKPLGPPKGEIKLISRKEIKSCHKTNEAITNAVINEMDKYKITKVYFPNNKKLRAELNEDKKEVRFYDEKGKIIYQEKAEQGKIILGDTGETYGININPLFTYKDKTGKQITVITNVTSGDGYFIRNKGQTIWQVTPFDGMVGIDLGIKAFNKKGERIYFSERYDGISARLIGFITNKFVIIQHDSIITFLEQTGKKIWEKDFIQFSNLYWIYSDNKNYYYFLHLSPMNNSQLLTCVDYNGNIKWTRIFTGYIPWTFFLVNNDINLAVFEETSLRIQYLNSLTGQLIWSRDINEYWVKNELKGGGWRDYTPLRGNNRYCIFFIDKPPVSNSMEGIYFPHKNYFFLIFNNTGKYIKSISIEKDKDNPIRDFKINNNELIIIKEKENEKIIYQITE